MAIVTQGGGAVWNRALRPKSWKLAENRTLARLVADKVRLLIAQWLQPT